MLTLVVGGCGPVQPHGAPVPAERGTVVEQPWRRVQPLADPRTYQGLTTARLVTDGVVAVAGQTPHLPATVTDVQGTRVTVSSDDRILALDLYGSLAATVQGLGLGDHLVGRVQSTGFTQAAHLPVVTSGAHQLSAEAILALHPTVLITDTTLGPWSAVQQVAAAGVPVVVVSPKRSMATIEPMVTQVAAALGVPQAGQRLVRRIRAGLAASDRHVAALAPAEAADRPRMLFLYARGQAGVYDIFGEGSGADSLIRALGGVDVAGEEGIDGFVPLNAEALARARPDVLVMMTGGVSSLGGLDGVLELPGVAQTPAGRHRRVVDMDDYQILGFGPQTPAVVDALARAVYAPASVRIESAVGRGSAS